MRSSTGEMATDVKNILQRILAPGIVYVGIGIAVTTVVAVCAGNAIERSGKPFPGFFVWENLFVPAVGESYWSGAASGLRYQSWLLEADGRTIQTATDLADAIDGREPGEAIHYVLEKAGERYQITAPVMEMDLRAWLSVLGIYLLDSVVLLALGLTVLYMKPDDAASRALFLFCADLAFYIGTSTDIFGASWFRIPYFFAINLLPTTVLNLLSRFPVGRQRRRWEDRALIALALAGLLHGAVSNAAFWHSRRLLLASEALTHALLAAVGLVAIAFFAWHFFRARTLLVRERAKVVLLGTISAFTLPVVGLSLIYGFGMSFPFNFLTMAFVLFPVGIGYAIAKHDLFDIDRVIKRTLVYAVLSAFVFGLYTIIIGYIDYRFENLTEAGSRLAEGILILVLILITGPSRRRIQNVVDRLYDRRSYDYRSVVRSASRAFTTILDFERLVHAVIDLIDETVQPELARLYTVGPGGSVAMRGRLDHLAGHGREVEVGRAAEHEPALAPLARVLERRDLLSAEADEPATNADGATVTALLAAMNASLAVAMRLETRLVGIMVVGRRRAGGRLTSDDVDLLRTIADQLAVALENAQAYEVIDLLNRNLESKNVALERANRELRTAQDEVVRNERLAAVGELSAAVAHAIRNPLAGIKAAAQLALLELDEHAAAASVSDVVAETDRLNDRISALLDFSHPFQPVLEPGSLARVVSNAARATEAKARARSVRIDTDGVGEMPVTRLDPVLLEEAAAELISNAIDMSPDGATVEVATGCGLEDGYDVAWIEVRDSGPGIGAEQQARLFELFYTTKPKGTGFGLATVRKIVERHGGVVRATNRQSGGACFRIVVPVGDGDRG